jgi:hypothetical protein
MFHSEGFPTFPLRISPCQTCSKETGKTTLSEALPTGRAGRLASTGEVRYAYKIFVDKPEEEGPLGIPRPRK